MPDHEVIAIVLCVQIKDEKIGVHEPREKRAARAEYAEAFPPDRQEVWTEDVRHRVMDEIEATVLKRAEVTHVAKHGLDRESFAVSNSSVLIELARRVAEDGDVGASSSKHGSLLTTTRCKAKDVDALQIHWKPIARCGLIADQHYRSIAGTSAGNDFGADRARPLAVLRYELVPGCTIMGNGIDVIGHARR